MTFDHALFTLYKEGKIDLDQALVYADSANNLRLKIKMEGLKGGDVIDQPPDKKEEERQKGFQIKGMKPAGRTFRKI
ncbi:MAG: hypothetical protein O7B35_19580 [Deltaproteobacteria bacterium]|nr:hypothetical protein [Deltaproteobacteria bacterium]